MAHAVMNLGCTGIVPNDEQVVPLSRGREYHHTIKYESHSVTTGQGRFMDGQTRFPYALFWADQTAGRFGPQLTNPGKTR